MHPLLFVNWSSVNGIFRGLMWLAVLVLVGVIATHFMPGASATHHAVRTLR